MLSLVVIELLPLLDHNFRCIAGHEPFPIQICAARLTTIKPPYKTICREPCALHGECRSFRPSRHAFQGVPDRSRVVPLLESRVPELPIVRLLVLLLQPIQSVNLS